MGFNLQKYKGILFTILSATIFGFTPILGRITYDGGSNGITLTFLRSILALPVLYFLVRRRGLSIRVAPSEVKKILLTGVVGSALTTILLYSSYTYISVGMATTLHFVYPLVISVACVVLFKEKMTPLKICALVLATAGIFFFADKSSGGSAMGFILAIASGFFWSFYVIYLDKSGLKNMYYFKLSFYLCSVAGITAGLFGLVSGQLAVLQLTPKAWLYSFIVAVLTSVGAVTLFQLGVLYVGPSTSAILSTFEPITSIVCGVLILGESLSLLKIIGCVLILSGVILITLSESKKSPPADPPAEDDTDGAGNDAVEVPALEPRQPLEQ